MERLWAVQKPPGRKYGWSFDRFFSGIREAGGHDEGEPANAGGAIAGNDVGVAPLHYTWTKLMPKLERVDEEPRRSGLLRFPDKEAERGHESAIGHGGCCREPVEL